MFAVGQDYCIDYEGMKATNKIYENVGGEGNIRVRLEEMEENKGELREYMRNNIFKTDQLCVNQSIYLLEIIYKPQNVNVIQYFQIIQNLFDEENVVDKLLMKYGIKYEEAE